MEIDCWGKMDSVVFVSFEFKAFLYFGGAESAQKLSHLLIAANVN